MRASLAIAAVAAVLAGCHGSDRPRGPVTITVTWAAPVAGVPVVFHRPDGSVQEVAVTGEDGKATAEITEGALVTVAQLWPGTLNVWDLVTVAGVAPGDALALDPYWGWGTTGEATVVFPGPVDGASSYRVDAACTAAVADAGYVDTAPLPLSSGCAGMLDAVALARAPGGELLAYAVATGVPIWGEGPAYATVMLEPWRTDFASLALEATGAPAGAAAVYAVLEPKRSGRRFFHTAMVAGASLSEGGSASLGLPYPLAFATSARLSTTVRYERPSSGGYESSAALVDPDVALDAPLAIDLSASLPPRLSDPTLFGAHGSLVASWRQAAADPGLDGAILGTFWTADNGMHTWNVVLPPGVTRFAFPPLPPALSAFGPTAAEGPTGFSVTSYDDPSVSGYPAFRATRLGLLSPSPGNELSLRVTQTSTTQ